MFTVANITCPKLFLALEVNWHSAADNSPNGLFNSIFPGVTHYYNSAANCHWPWNLLPTHFKGVYTYIFLSCLSQSRHIYLHVSFRNLPFENPAHCHCQHTSEYLRIPSVPRHPLGLFY